MNDEEMDDPNPATAFIENPLDIVRYTDRTIHLSPNSRKKEIDIMVKNSSDEPVDFILVPLK